MTDPEKGYTCKLYVPIMKRCDGKETKYMGVLSDTSVDRDEERLSSDCIRRISLSNDYLAALCNHNNDVFMQVGEWINKRVEQIDGHTAIIADIKFYKSNPNAQIIKGMLDEGAKLGISIGAIVNDSIEENGYKVYTDLELVEASFVGVPSNRHGRAMAVAKSFNKTEDISKMDNTYTQKDLDSAVTKKVDEVTSEFKTQLETKSAENTELTKKFDAMEAEFKEATVKSSEMVEKIASLEKELIEAKSTILEKQKFIDQSGNDSGKVTVDTDSEEFQKSLSSGKLPVMRGV